MSLRHWIPIAVVFAVLILDIIDVTIERQGDKIESLRRRLKKGSETNATAIMKRPKG